MLFKSLFMAVVIGLPLYGAIDPLADIKIAEKSAEIAFLETKKVSLIAAREAAKLPIRTALGVTTIAIEGTKQLLDTITAGFSITSMEMHSKGTDIMGGKLPKVLVKFTFLGQKKELSLDVDFKKPDESMKNIVSSLLNVINPF